MARVKSAVKKNASAAKDLPRKIVAAKRPAGWPNGDAQVKKKKPSRRGAFAQYRAYRRAVLKLSKKTDVLVPKLAFARVVREIAQGYKSDVRFRKGALLAVQFATEDFLEKSFNSASLLAMHAKRHKITPTDLRLGLMLGEKDQQELQKSVNAPINMLTVTQSRRRRPVKIQAMKSKGHVSAAAVIAQTDEDALIEAENAKMKAQLAATGSIE